MVFFPLLPLLINGYQDLYNSPMGFLIDGDALHHIAILQVSYVACFYLPLLPRTCRLPLADVPASYPPLRFLAPVVYLSPMYRRVTLLYASLRLRETLYIAYAHMQSISGSAASPRGTLPSSFSSSTPGFGADGSLLGPGALFLPLI